MKVLKSIAQVKEYSRGYDEIGFVPTMGALHAGHAELIKKCVAENEVTIVSIYVNPTQFNDLRDLENYPVDLEADYKLLQELGVHAVFLPQFSEIYADHYRYKISENQLSLDLCGENRPGHFDGVLTVVMKLFNIVKPTRAYLGEKDFQQLSLIQGMVKAFFLDVKIIPVSTQREESGLAMSSRNRLLSEVARKKAAKIYQAISSDKDLAQIENDLIKEGLLIDYLKEREGRRYIAAKLEGVRLIDNVER